MAVSGMIAGLFRSRPMVADRVAAGLLGLGAVVGLGGAIAAVASPTAHGLAGPWALPWGRLVVAVDGISAAFLFPTLLVPALAAIYGVGYWPQQAHPESAARVRVFLGLLAGAMTTLLIARDAVLFLMAFEVMTLSAFFLVTTEDGRSEVREAGWVYLAASHTSFLLLLAMFTVLQALTGSFELTAVAPGSMGLGARSVLFLLALVAFGIKAGVMPFHVWLPPAHASAPSHVSALMSGVLIKIGVYGIVRVLAMLPEPPVSWGVVLLLLGAASGIAGVAFAIAQHDIKRLLAYHSIENIGIIVMGIGLAVVGRATHAPLLVVLGLGAAVLHVWNHAIFKALLFLSAGVVVHATGTRDIDRMGGLGRALPWSSALFTLGAVAICGLPPLNGFVSELILYLGAFESLKLQAVRLGALVAPVLAVIGALACACFVKVVGSVFLGMPRDHTVPPGHEAGWSMRAPMVILASLCVVLGVVPVIAFPVLDAAVASWMGRTGAGELPPVRELMPFPAIGVIVAVVAAIAASLSWVLMRAARGAQIAGTWDCGYAQITSRMQYTGSSFGRTLVDLLRPILRPHRHDPVLAGAFPVRSAFRLHVGDVVFERWVLPLVERFADRCSRLRTRQALRIQMYIVYVVAATVGLLLFLIDVRELLRAAVFE
jgi:hydrogenase-4 component B